MSTTFDQCKSGSRLHSHLLGTLDSRLFLGGRESLASVSVNYNRFYTGQVWWTPTKSWTERRGVNLSPAGILVKGGGH